VIPVDNGRTDSDRLSVPCVQCKKYVLRIYVLYRTYSGDTRTMMVAGRPAEEEVKASDFDFIGSSFMHV